MLDRLIRMECGPKGGARMVSTALAPFIRKRIIAGYSLVELLASLVLIAMIAVLALPTYQDFEAHTSDGHTGAQEEARSLPQADEAHPAQGESGDSEEKPEISATGQVPQFDAEDALAES